MLVTLLAWDIQAPSIAGNIGQFVNPFEQQVVSGALGDIERQRQMQANQLGVTVRCG
jgi:hypothetical protein